MSIDCIRATQDNAPLFDSLDVQPLMVQEWMTSSSSVVRPPGHYAFAATLRNPQIGWTPISEWPVHGVTEPVHYKETFLSRCVVIEAKDQWNGVKITFRASGDSTPRPHPRFLTFYGASFDGNENQAHTWVEIKPWVHVARGSQTVFAPVRGCAAGGTVLVTTANTQPGVTKVQKMRTIVVPVREET